MAAFDNLKSLEPTKKALSLYEEFKAFAFKGNVIDLAVAVIIGSAFGKVVDSLVKQILLPLIAAITPGQEGYVGWKATINGSVIHYGQFIGEVVNFLLVAAAVFFFIVKFLGWVMRTRQKEATAPTPPLSKQEELLTEIRDLLKTARTTAPPA
jgi:large conductance mechanosensitive channel